MSILRLPTRSVLSAMILTAVLAGSEAEAGPPGPSLTGTIADQQLPRGTAITPIDVAAIVTGDGLSYRVHGSSEDLPDGLELTSAGLIEGTPERFTDAGFPTFVVIEVSNAGGSVLVPFTIDIQGPRVEGLATDGTDISFTTDFGEGTAYVYFGNELNPTRDDIKNGTGTGHLASTSFTITGSGGQVASFDLNAFADQSGFLYVIHVDATGSHSDIVFIEITVGSSSTPANPLLSILSTNTAYNTNADNTRIVTTTTAVTVPADASIVVVASGGGDATSFAWSSIEARVRAFGAGTGGTLAQVDASRDGGKNGVAIFRMHEVPAGLKDGSNQIEVELTQTVTARSFRQLLVQVYVLEGMQDVPPLDSTGGNPGNSSGQINYALPDPSETSLVIGGSATLDYSGGVDFQASNGFIPPTGFTTTQDVSSGIAYSGNSGRYSTWNVEDVTPSNGEDVTVDYNRFTSSVFAMVAYPVGPAT